MEPKSHWQQVYQTKLDNQVSWFETSPQQSLDYIAQCHLEKDAPIIDVGAGASKLVDKLLEDGYSDITCVDISSKALEVSKLRLGNVADKVTWLTSDATQMTLTKQYGLWHDRAVFHFLTEPQDRQNYLNKLNPGLAKGGHLVISTFAPSGPQQCSGLDIVQYDSKKLQLALGDGFQLVSSSLYSHQTPWGSEQQFCYCHFIKL